MTPEETRKRRREYKQGECARCGRTRPIRSKGMCAACYETTRIQAIRGPAKIRVPKTADCVRCKRVRRIKAKGLCEPCYETVWRQTHREASRAKVRKYATGWPSEQFNAAWVRCAGQCEICGCTLDPRGQKANSVMADHCHKTGNLRGLPCANCNRGLGLFKDNPIALASAIAYLKKYGAQ